MYAFHELLSRNTTNPFLTLSLVDNVLVISNVRLRDLSGRTPRDDTWQVRDRFSQRLICLWHDVKEVRGNPTLVVFLSQSPLLGCQPIF